LAQFLHTTGKIFSGAKSRGSARDTYYTNTDDRPKRYAVAEKDDTPPVM
jgi:hypothetical protein